MPVAAPVAVANLYQDTRQRLVALLADPDVDWNAPVRACPGWSVRDVLAHVTAVAEDCADGTLTRPPTDAETAAQIARFEKHDREGIAAAWSAASARLDRLAEDTGVAPPLADLTCHEHDVRAAIGRPGARHSAAVWHSSDQLLTILQTPVPLRVVVEDGVYRTGPEGGSVLSLHTTRFDALRWRTGRRSRAQLVAMDWSDDPSPVLEHLFLFGPATVDAVE
jgi:hypothetical protein